MLSAFNLCNVVWYDGQDAYVSKFILMCEGMQPTEESKERVSRYLKGNGDILKIDCLYPLTLANISALSNSEDSENVLCYNRFEMMYFVI